ncbi:MAG: hypothetical protein CMJ64_04750 [Planctomycetaceae bacterium]|nr:hypothetical protein [Planctomycetaceae bacterium]
MGNRPTVFEADAATLALFRFDEGNGETLGDSSGNKNHGEVRGAKWVTGDGIRHRAALGLAEFGRFTVPMLTEALAHEDPEVQLEAISALGIVGQDAAAAIPALRELADDDDKRVQASAAQAIKAIETRGVLKSILNLFQSSR